MSQDHNSTKPQKINWTNQKRKVDDLVPATYNPRNLTEEQEQRLNESLARFDVCDPIIINTNNIIIGGHQRLKILKKRGVEEVDVRVPSRELTLDEEKELNVRLNKNTGEFDFEKLADFDKDMLIDIGFDDIDLNKIFPIEVDEQDDEVPEIPEEPKTKLGDLYKLGNHRLLCGDSTNVDDVERLMDGKKADMVFTDPPYSSGGSQESGKTSGSIGARGSKKIKNDNLSTRGYRLLMLDVIALLSHSHSIFIFCDWKMWIETYDIVERSGYRVRNMLVWDKEQMGMGMPFRNQHELCLFGSKIAGKIGNGKTSNVLKCKRDRTTEHATPKPIELIVNMLMQIPSKYIIDPFLGSGSTLIACEKTNRICYGMELDPKYCDVIVQRWEEYTGKKAELIGN